MRRPGAGGDDESIRLTLTDDSCEYHGPVSVPSGLLSVEVENRSDANANGTFEVLGPCLSYILALRRTARGRPEAGVKWIVGLA